MRAAFGLIAVLAVAGCGQDIAQDVEPSHQWQVRYRFPTDWAKERMVVVVDDDAGAEATALRAWLRGALLRALEHRAELATNILTEADPAAWQAVDWRAVTVSPSGDLDVGATPIVLQTIQLEAEAMEAFAEAIVDALPVGGEGVYQPLENAFHAAALLEGESAADPAAEAFQSTLRGVPPTIAVASTRDDAGGTPIESLLPDQLESAEGTSPWFAVLPPGPGYCPPTDPTPGRFTDWIEAAGPAEPPGWECVRDDDEERFPFTGFVDHDHRVDCPSRPVLRDETGMPRCSVTVEVAPDTSCDADRGWADPLGADGVRVPTLETVTLGEATLEVRVCEVLALEGAARQACEDTVECTACGSGWCGTHVEEVLASCVEGVPSGLRFVGGAAGGDSLRLVCDLEP
jgi:hypothetical protein